ncbi:hypothetical protein OJAV_G00212610 [Oryzias javanicus]|uniref:Uncharacterized protein n=1 Tax=Oryzias javanicus TaxID=123683 RepID=A0A3S2PBE0_ORYJA|nr:hypothetical protein OJAV_G00212610 [Oryzias javanicus]
MPGQAGGQGAYGEKAFLAVPASYKSSSSRERARGALHAASAKSATQRRRDDGGNLTPERREKPLTGLSMSALRAGLCPDARQPRRRGGQPGVDDHASITMSPVGQAAKTSNKRTELPC